MTFGTKAAPRSRRARGADRIRDVVHPFGTIRPIQTERIEAQADSYDGAKTALEAQVPDGWPLLTILTER
ncbi:hypothetical protein GCM10027090_09900 [Sinomonas soli]